MEHVFKPMSGKKTQNNICGSGLFKDSLELTVLHWGLRNALIEYFIFLYSKGMYSDLYKNIYL